MFFLGLIVGYICGVFSIGALVFWALNRWDDLDMEGGE